MEYSNLDAKQQEFLDEFVMLAAESIDDAGTFTPFAAIRVNGETELQRFVGDDDDLNYRAAMNFILDADPQPDIAIAVFPGRLKINEEIENTIMAQLYLPGVESGWLYGQVFRVEDDEISLLGETMYVQELVNVLELGA